MARPPKAAAQHTRPHIGAVRLGVRPTVVVSITDREIGLLRRADGAPIAELRVDRFARNEGRAVAATCRQVRARGFALLGTVRSRTEGGAPLSETTRRRLYGVLVEEADAVDVEIAAGRLRDEVVEAARSRRRTVILSFHDFAATPPAARLRAVVERGRAAGADLVKIAVRARNLADVRRLLEFTLAHRRHNLVTIALGPVGTVSRVLFPLAGSLLTYAFLGRPTGPGQLGLGELVCELERYYPSFRRAERARHRRQAPPP